MGRSLTALYFAVQMGTKWLPEKGLVRDFSSRVSASPDFGNIQKKRALFSVKLDLGTLFRSIFAYYLETFMWIDVLNKTPQST